MKEMQAKDFPSKRFDPFRRTDRYGPRGTTPQPPLEVARSVVVALALAPLKLALTLSAVVFFYFVCRFSPVLFPDESRRARVVTALGRRCSRLALLGLGFVSVRYEDVPADELPEGYPSSPPTDGGGDDTEDDEEVDAGDGDRSGGVASSSGADGGDGGDAGARRRRRGSGGRRKGSASSTPLAAGAIVSNHCGWIDVLVHMAAPPYPLKDQRRPSSSRPAPKPTTTTPSLFSSFPSFVARASTADLPLIGVISRAIGCLYVDRSKAAGASGIAALVRERVAAAAEAGRRAARRGKRHRPSGVLWPPPLLLFPEGTTTNGRYLLRFKTGAFLAGCPVAPVLLSYGPSPGHGFNPSWESIAAGRHAALLLAQPWLTAVVRRLPPYYPSAAERRDPALYASRVRDAMLSAGDWAPSDSTIADKWEYQALLQGKPPRPPPTHPSTGAASKAASAASNGNAGSPPSKAAARKGRGDAAASSVRATSGGGGAAAAPPAAKKLET